MLCPPNWSVRGHYIYASPTLHVLGGLCFDSSGFDATTFYVWVFVLPLCVPRNIVSLNFGKRLRSPKGNAWDKHDPDLIPQLQIAITQEALPFLAEVQSLSALADVVAAKYSTKNPHTREALAYALAYSGQLEAAHRQLEQLLQMMDTKIPWQREIAERATLLKSKLANLQDVQQQLKMWEMESRSNLKVD